jgi:hypothetical protein
MKNTITNYHIFADNIDLYEPDLVSANKEFDRLLTDGQTNIRLYKVVEEEENGDYTEISSECLRSIGEFPR